MTVAKAVSLKEQIKAEAFRLGFSLFGVTDLSETKHFQIYQTWLNNHLHGDMHYLETNRAKQLREKPYLLVNDCQTVLVVGMVYPCQPLDRRLPKGFGKIASYALNEDYHLIIPSKLNQLGEFIQNMVGKDVVFHPFTDSAPILERELAVRSGLGWIGKNGCVISTNFGSLFLLGELFISVDLEIDTQTISDRCGKCTRCIDACPTHCILSNRTIDSRRCLSYLTIEHRQNIELELRTYMQEWVFGCDICQQVCPWNSKPLSNTIAPQNHSMLDLTSLLELDQNEFQKWTSKSALSRSKRSGIGRNAALLLGNQGVEGHIQIIVDHLENDPDPIVRLACAWTLGRFASKEAYKVLKERLFLEPEEEIRTEIRTMLYAVEKSK